MWDSLHSLSTSGDPQLPTSRDTDNAITFNSCQQIFCPTGLDCNWIKLCQYFVSEVLCDSSFSSATSRKKQHLPWDFGPALAGGSMSMEKTEEKDTSKLWRVKDYFFSLLKIFL